MNISTLTGTAFSLALAGAGVVAVAGPPAEAAGNCLLTVENIDGVAGDEVVAQDLNEKQDDIIIKIGGERFPSSGEVEFSRVGQGHSAAAFDAAFAFNGSTRMKVVEVDPVFNDVMGATDIACAPLSSTLVFNDRGAGAYTVEVSVEVL
jgi:hypothetical protein